MKARYTLRALKQIETALDFVASESPAGAARLQDRISVTVDLVVRHPGAGQKTNRDGVRRVVLAPVPYVIFYRVRADEIVVLRFRHAARKPV